MARWTLAGGLETLGILQSTEGHVLLAAAGDVIVGSELDGPCHRWTEAAGDQELGLLPGMSTCFPLLMNDAGDVVLGGMQATPDGPMHLFRWTLARGLQDLQPADAAGVLAWPNAMSADGSVVAVQLCAMDGSLLGAARWTEATGVQELAPGKNLITTYVSPTGDVLIGTDLDDTIRVDESGTRGWMGSFRWTEADGVQSLGNAGEGLALEGKLMVGMGAAGPEIRKLGELGSGARLVDLLPPGIVPEGWSDAQLDGISEDGGMLLGDALNPDGERQIWLQHLSCPAP